MPIRCLTVTGIANRVAHRLDAVADEHRLGHQAGAERAALHPLARAAAVEVDLGIAPRLAEPGRRGELGRLAAAELERDRMLALVEVEMARHVAVQQRAGRHHLGVKPGLRLSRRWKKRQCRSVHSIIGATQRRQSAAPRVTEVVSTATMEGLGMGATRAHRRMHTNCTRGGRRVCDRAGSDSRLSQLPDAS